MILKKSIMVGLALCCPAQIAFADDVGLTKQFSACMDKSGGVTVDMLNCIGEETKRQDIRLNKAYKEVTKQLSPTRKKQLQDVQRTWLKYREANCNFYAVPDGERWRL